MAQSVGRLVLAATLTLPLPLYQMAQSVGRLVLAGRELTKLAGFTARIHEFGQVRVPVQSALLTSYHLSYLAIS